MGESHKSMLLQDWLHHHHNHHNHHPATTAAEPKSQDTMHMRKPSCSDSVSSLSSTSTNSSTASSPTRLHHRQHSRVIDFDPLCLNPTFQAPPRLSERPFKQSNPVEFSHPRPIRQAPTRELQLPPVSSPASNHDRNEEAPDYFHLKLELLRRPTLQRSHWSESTIQTVEVDVEEDTDEEPTGGAAPEQEEVATPTPTKLQFEYGERLVRPVTAEQWQNFSYKRNTVPRRPPMTTGDSIENYIKRGGWKRRGIVFQQSQEDGESTDRYSAHTVI